MPEQEFPPPRPPARPYRPGRDEEDPPPWANLPPVRPARPRRPAGGGHPAGPRGPASGGRPRSPAGPGFTGGYPVAGPGGAGGRHAGPGSPDGHQGSDGHPGSPDALRGRPAGPDANPRHASAPGQDEPEPPWDQWEGPEADAGQEVPPAEEMPPAEEVPRAEPRPGVRALRAAARRRRRWFVMAGGVVVVAGAALAVVLLVGGRPGPAPVTPGSLVTTFQPGELRQVPAACQVVPGATVQQYLTGKPKVASPLPVNGSAESACDWTVDKPPVYRLMELNMLAYTPNGLASGDGSATFAATDAYELALRDMQAPPKGSPAPQATVRILSGFGNEAFSALRVYRVGGAVTDVATVMVRYHNVVVTVTLNGLEHSNKGSYGPVSPSALATAAMAFAQAAEASLR